jgi:DNA modification methylase
VIGSAQIIQADARQLPLADDSVDLICTSPPYFALRAYQDAGETYAGQLGSEPTPAEFVDALIEVTAECVRVLKPSGSLWVNLGDKYAGPLSGDRGQGTGRGVGNARWDRIPGVKSKSLIGIPWRYAIRCIDDLGLILRAEVIWSKPNGLPESVTDRVRRSHEQWFHFTVQPRYFSAVDEIREQYAPGTAARYAAGYNSTKMSGERLTVAADYSGANYAENPLGKLPGSVWTIPTEPLQVPDHLGVDHFAAYPTEWPRRIIMGWSPAGVCVACGEGRRPVVHRATLGFDNNPRKGMGGGDKDRWVALKSADPDRITGYACACPTPDAPTRPSTILDPFGGTGTTALVAKALGRTGISVDLSRDYCRLAEWRVNDSAQLAKAARVPKPPHIPDTQLGFDLEGIA